MKHQKKGLPKFKLIFASGVFIMLFQTCWPPMISSSAKNETKSIGSIYFDVSKVANQPIVVTGKVTTSLFINYVGGFYFLKDLEGKKSMICFTWDVPPADGSKVAVLGKVKPVFEQGDFKLLYFKTKHIYSLKNNRMDHAALY